MQNYICTPQTLRATLNEYGVAIIPNVLNNEECNKMISETWDFFETISSNWEIPINRNNPNTWRGFYDLYPKHSMLIQNWSVGHCQASWNLRQNEKIVNIFAQLWACNNEDLLVSFDGLSFHLPPEDTNRGWNKNNTWYHVDQSYKRPNFECIQSWVTACDVNKGDATLSVYEKSHRYTTEFANTFNVDTSDNWYKLSEAHQQFYKNKGCNIVNIECSKGSMVFWDSRLVHCGVEPNKDRANKNLRCVIYLCYMPRNTSNEAQIAKKQKAFNDLRTTSHWANKVKLFPKLPRTYGEPLPDIKEIQKPVLTPLGMKLAGF